jgi:hypothetical protein
MGAVVGVIDLKSKVGVPRVFPSRIEACQCDLRPETREGPSAALILSTYRYV